MQIAIIGAGAAGIAAGRWLAARGERPILFEARGRVGGRAWTDTATFGFAVDYGCAWLHSAERNPWTGYARAAGFALLERSPVWQEFIGNRRATAEYLAAWGAAFTRNDQLISQAAAAGQDVAVSRLVPADVHRPMFDAVMTWLMGTDSDHVSSIDFARYDDTSCNWAVRAGLGALVTHAAQALDVRLETPVEAVDWSGPRVRLTTPRGVFDADAVIVTLPTPLVAGEAVRFTPALPPALMEAFAAVPLGVANKVFVEMAPGTLPHAGSVHFVGTDRSARTGGYQTRPSAQEVLLCYYGGPLAAELEQQGALEAFAREELGRIFGAQFGAQIRRCVSTAWVSDRHARGSYSAALPGHALARCRLGEPLAQKVFFAGEACSIEAFGTVHGAWRSGVAAASALLRTASAT